MNDCLIQTKHFQYERGINSTFNHLHVYGKLNRFGRNWWYSAYTPAVLRFGYGYPCGDGGQQLQLFLYRCGWYLSISESGTHQLEVFCFPHTRYSSIRISWGCRQQFFPRSFSQPGYSHFFTGCRPSLHHPKKAGGYRPDQFQDPSVHGVWNRFFFRIYRNGWTGAPDSASYVDQIPVKKSGGCFAGHSDPLGNLCFNRILNERATGSGTRPDVRYWAIDRSSTGCLFSF
uniref:Uncharacterized protein n=1 Tax=uncultured marine microorganism HF4000_APKG10F17 TaxID=455558 RepID=B3TC25_9ZZZZ|nr:hypothetical protein ALOHA_HF4000APKG10F17ctg1g34 [uncultured marine microorganism HF4000_APKG10F17]